MAIVKMSKISLIGMSSSRQEIVNELMELSAVDINTQEQKLVDEQWAAMVEKDSNESETMLYEGELSKAAGALLTLSKYDKSKKPLFRTRKLMEKQIFESAVQSREKILGIIGEVHSLSEELNRIRAEENRIKAGLATLKPWIQCDLALDFAGTRKTRVVLGTVPAVSEVGKMCEEINSGELGCLVTQIGSDAEQHYLSALYYIDDEEELLLMLRQYGFARVQFKDFSGSAAENTLKLEKELESVAIAYEETESKIIGYVDAGEQIELIHDSLIMERDKARIVSRLLKTQHAFYLDGYLPSDRVSAAREAMEGYDCSVEIEEPEKGEECPVLLKNNKVVAPFEAITNMYSTPTYTGFDPAPFLSIFYFVFFGLMFGDAAYGVVLFLGSFLLLKKFRLENMSKQIITMLMYCGISTFICGVLFGSWFGDAIAVATKTFLGTEYKIAPLWFDPLADPMLLLILGCGLGIVHLFVGMGIKAYMLVKNGDVFAAVFDIGSWYLLIIGLFLLLAGNMLIPGSGTVGMWMSIAGTAMIILTGGRDSKNPFLRLANGVLSLYNITGYLSDILSYSRVLALGLGTGVVSSVFNTMGSLGGGSIVGAILFVLVFVVGHVFNMAINALGSYVHSSRLQYVEFFGKFFEGGGRTFKPLKKATKYVEII